MTHSSEETLYKYNADLAPVKASQKTWTAYNFLTVWMGMVHNIISYEVAGGLILLGMSAWEAIFTIIVGNLILLVPMLLNGYQGTRLRVPFPVLIRSSFGVKGAVIPVILRAVVGIGWFSVQTYFIATIFNSLLALLWHGWTHVGGSFNFLGMNLTGWITFMLSWFLNVLILRHGMNSIKRFEAWAGPLVLILALGLIIWSVRVSHGFGPLFHQGAHFPKGQNLSTVFVPALTGVISSWATLVLNIGDFTRFSETQRAQIVGQSLGLPGTAIVFSFMSIMITSGSLVAFGHAIWNPITLLTHFHNIVILALGGFALVIATISVNVSANIVSPAYDITNLFPRHLNFVSAGIVAATLAIFLMPWKLMQNPTTLFTFLGAIGGLLGPVAGVMIADFWLIHHRRIHVMALYQRDGAYSYWHGFNLRALAALGLGVSTSAIGYFNTSLHWLYAYSWFIGLGLALVVYWVLSRIWPGEAPELSSTNEMVNAALSNE
ncbi:nucleobase:cation symporter-1, NCS1 family [Sulfobacillus thermosulfidooxidans DSM 9293]|uniref:Nucleobase:cation symporter-1, NCS1 family n=1 Tax=Sulfobacillus thermosulfidooxidans (strain DSM 9293 / VKM B-1269 / AT-1) TaxID=929705 RepID=A0A1W1WL47_SULTA|nr:NCS1 family nucleobase:cation symporter-1 [Sulfobacillus thermosulfidooxidans]SMC07038.1 nucleobase:cation symporter-1, NCS1 family [Sulfobacillus thermosulfidooxidans DSM 9293]